MSGEEYFTGHVRQPYFTKEAISSPTAAAEQQGSGGATSSRTTRFYKG